MGNVTSTVTHQDGVCNMKIKKKVNHNQANRGINAVGQLAYHLTQRMGWVLEFIPLIINSHQ